ncbi:MAG: phosphorylase, partial [Gammaproteobacteria bacterium]
MLLKRAPFRTRLVSGSLYGELVLRWGEALAAGALHPLPTELHRWEAAGVRWAVRRLAGPSPKPARGGRDPFAPPEPRLTVAELTDTHLAVLNKFPVLPLHLLLVTRAWREQEEALDAADLGALWLGLVECGGLGFHNGGRVAGASQPHKHLQLVPGPLAGPAAAPGEPPVPTEPWFRGLEGAEPRRLAALPCLHAACAVADLPEDPAEAGRDLARRYARLWEAVGRPLGPGPRPRQPLPHNLLLTRRWMLLVPRARER